MDAKTLKRVWLWANERALDLEQELTQMHALEKSMELAQMHALDRALEGAMERERADQPDGGESVVPDALERSPELEQTLRWALDYARELARERGLERPLELRELTLALESALGRKRADQPDGGKR